MSFYMRQFTVMFDTCSLVDISQARQNVITEEHLPNFNHNNYDTSHKHHSSHVMSSMHQKCSSNDLFQFITLQVSSQSVCNIRQKHGNISMCIFVEILMLTNDFFRFQFSSIRRLHSGKLKIRMSKNWVNTQIQALHMSKMLLWVQITIFTALCTH